MKKLLLVGLFFSISLSTYSYEAYVSKDRATVYLNHNSNSKTTNTLGLGDKVDVLEDKNGFSRISKYYDGSLEGVSGNVARWIKSDLLSKTPTKPNVIVNTELELALKGSDDFHLYKDKFTEMSQELIFKGKCTLNDFKEWGGWMRSTKKHNTYFTYCGGSSLGNKVEIVVK